MCVTPKAPRRVEIADIFRRFGPAYRATRSLHPRQHQAMRAIEQCRTPAMGGHLQACDHCNTMVVRFHSCLMGKIRNGELLVVEALVWVYLNRISSKRPRFLSP
ncbi:MAG: transposase zinc-binding domain-containing protein [Geminicoccaceae bacterium]